MTITDKPVDFHALLRDLVAPDPVADPVIPDDIAAQARELDKIRQAKKILKDREDAIRPALNAFLDELGQEAVAENGVSIARSSHTRLNIDREFLETQYPKVYAAVSAPVPVTQVRVTVT